MCNGHKVYLFPFSRNQIAHYLWKVPLTLCTGYACLLVPQPLKYSESYFIIFTNPSRSRRIWHNVNFKRGLTGLNSEFSFSKTSCPTKDEELSLPYP